LLRPGLAAHPGIRVPGAWDGFELAVRAVVGQQISVAAATTMAGRIATMFGAEIAAVDDLSRLFPTPLQLATAKLERAGIIAARAETIRRLARLALEGRVAFDRGDALTSMRAVPGIGEWTTGYVAMRALGEPDAFLPGDLVLRRAAGGCSARELDRTAEAWRPWRAYAVMLLWQGESDDRALRANRPRHAVMDAARHLR
jgi:AraC family transcriptional regulator, regulatory protein of adaptative response / DNA-3-methyladenine glycosylase II